MSDEKKKVVDPDPERRWGFMERQEDGTEVFVSVPKVPLLLGDYLPPMTFELYGGVQRLIIAEPEK